MAARVRNSGEFPAPWRHGRMIRFAAGLMLVATSISHRAMAAEGIDFQRDVQPILAEHCTQCHGLDEAHREAGLRLDQRDAAISKLESGTRAIFPGDAAASELLRRVRSTDADVVMPPPHVKKPLSPKQIDLLDRWIAAGAEYSEHWAFTPPQATPGLTSIDAHVQAKLKETGGRLSPNAPLEILARRISLDVVGLPPSPSEVDAFVAAARIDRRKATADLVDRLLASPHYGERWARVWLDVARYADSNGYEKDLPRDQWAWRDWVINALNRDLPYDQFLIQQFAGDMLASEEPADTTAASLRRRQELVAATGFLRNGMINEEGAIVPEEFRMDGMFDRIDCLGKAVFGLSLQCGQCHSHKFDPITQREYYGLFACLNNTYEAQSWVYTTPQLERVAEVQKAVAAEEDRMRQAIGDWRTKYDAWQADERSRQTSIPWEPVEAIDLHSSTELNHPVQLPDKSILTLGHKTIFGDVYLLAQPKLAGVSGIRIEALTHGDLPYNGPGRSFKGTWAITELIVEHQSPGESKWEKLKLVNATSDYSEPDHKLEAEWFNASRDKDGKRSCGPVAFMVDGNDDTAWRADRGAGRRNAESVAVAQFEQPLSLPEGTKLKISVRTNHGGDDNGPKNVMLGRFRVSLTTSPTPTCGTTPYGAVLALRKDASQRSSREEAAVFAAWRESLSEAKPFTDAIDAAWKQYPEATTSVLHLAERSQSDFRETHLLDRGVWNRPKDVVAAHVPAALHAIQPRREGPPDRLDFARWLADRRSPLVARVAVNRIWQTIFGSGLVDTPEDFGLRAAVPVQRTLLDGLAADFMDRGWSQKQMVRQILLSDVYQQTSSAEPEAWASDPANRLLARGPRFRMDAEMVRDVALHAAGLVHLKVGGASLFPPVPESVIEYNYVKPTYWIAATGPERYRRSLYVFRKRSMPDPVLTTLDAPNADVACARRPRSNSPLASLVVLNETQFVEAARALALRVLNEGGATERERIDYAYRVCTGRKATQREFSVVRDLLETHRRRLADGWLSIREVATGDAKQLPKVPDGATPQDAAAWTLVSRVLLNLDETLVKP